MFTALKTLLSGAPKSQDTLRAVASRSGNGSPASASPARPASQPQAVFVSPNGTQDRAGGSGEKTGYEPAVLQRYQAPISVNARGIAGMGLFESGFSSRQVYGGQLGEANFYKALCKAGLIDNLSSYWSVAMPAQGTSAVRDPRFQSDIDCVIVQGSDLYLIDLKYYASGDVTWAMQDEQTLLCIDNQSGNAIGKPRRMSRNMAMAQDRFASIFPTHRLLSYVVLIPTNAGIGKVSPGTVWPGSVPLVTLPKMLDMLRAGGRGLADAHTDAALRGLLKDEAPAS